MKVQLVFVYCTTVWPPRSFASTSGALPGDLEWTSPASNAVSSFLYTSMGWSTPKPAFWVFVMIIWRRGQKQAFHANSTPSLFWKLEILITQKRRSTQKIDYVLWRSEKGVMWRRALTLFLWKMITYLKDKVRMQIIILFIINVNTKKEHRRKVLTNKCTKKSLFCKTRSEICQITWCHETFSQIKSFRFITTYWLWREHFKLDL